MGLKEKMMDNMMGQMSAEEKREMLNAMMDKFFADMSSEEKRKMMGDMMPKMMEMMTGHAGGGSGPLGMMGHFMGHRKSKEEHATGKEAPFNPMEMCARMMGGRERSGSLAMLSTDEIRTLFEEWAAQVEAEILELVKGGPEQDLEKMAGQLKISKKSLIYFLARLAQQDKIDLQVGQPKGD